MDVTGRMKIVMAVLCLIIWMPKAGMTQSLQEQFQAIRHRPLSPDVFEKVPPGFPVKLSVELRKNRSVDTRIRAFVNLDGYLLDVPLTNPTFNEADNLVFTAEIPAPVERMSYQFYVYGSDEKKAEVSQKYFLERACIPIFTKNSSDEVVPVDPSPELGVGELVAQSEDLNREIDLLDQSLNIVKKLKSEKN